ncbi:MAG TPA: serpin family protein [Polyangiaceae bacterium]|nr:serpin family protein [Polyangiaceae bacterium]
MRPLAALPLLAVLACKPTSSPADRIAFSFSSPEAKTAGDAIDAFGADLHRVVASKDGNLIYSPASISIALAMTEGGARGATKAEMDKVLHLPPNAQATYAGLLAKLGASKSPELNIANRLFGEKSFAFDPAFVKTTKDSFGAPLEPVDFRKDAEGARIHINGWVSDKTSGKIHDLLAPGMVGPDSRLVLTNAIYFKGKWAHAFDKAATRDDTFHAKTDETVPMMHETASAKLGEHANAQVLELGYQSDGGGPKVSMVIVLPKDVHGIGELEKSYASEGLAPFVASEQQTPDVVISLPKFKAETSLELAPTLAALGMKLAFGDTADFSGISKDPLEISSVVHKAFVDVDEQGTEAAAATAVTMVAAGAAPVSARFEADHPFLFFIRDTESGTVLFAGRLSDPKQG